MVLQLTQKVIKASMCPICKVTQNSFGRMEIAPTGALEPDTGNSLCSGNNFRAAAMKLSGARGLFLPAEHEECRELCCDLERQQNLSLSWYLFFPSLSAWINIPRKVCMHEYHGENSATALPASGWGRVSHFRILHMQKIFALVKLHWCRSILHASNSRRGSCLPHPGDAIRETQIGSSGFH